MMYSTDPMKKQQEDDLNDTSLPGGDKKADESVYAQEKDLDDLIHTRAIGQTKPDAEIDGDDEVHKAPPSKPKSSAMGDPDDMVHGD